MKDNLTISIDFIKQLKQQILTSRYVVAKMANAESLKLYYNIGKTIDLQAKKESWGAKVLETVSNHLQQELPGLRGFSASNLKKMRLFYTAWNDSALIRSAVTNQLDEPEMTIGSLPTNQLQNDRELLNYFTSVSFTHHFEIISAIKIETDRWYYIKNTSVNTWPVNHLRTELNNQSHLQEQKLPNNFNRTMPELLSNKAMRAFKDQYLLDFVNMEGCRRGN